MAYYCLLGGKSVENMRNFSIEEKVFKNLHLTPNKILFIPLACHPRYEEAIEKFKNLVPHSYCVEVVTEYENYPQLLEQMLSADVIYFSGGCAEELVRLVYKYKIDIILRQLKEENKLIIGISAGAILLSQYGMGDRYAYKDINHIYNYQMVKGIGCLNITLCPHYDHDGLECFNSEVTQYGYNGYALEDDTGILFAEQVKVFKICNKKSVYFFDVNQNYLMKALYEEKI